MLPSSATPVITLPLTASDCYVDYRLPLSGHPSQLFVRPLEMAYPVKYRGNKMVSRGFVNYFSEGT